MGIEPTTSRFYSHTLCTYATTGLYSIQTQIISLWYLWGYLKCCSAIRKEKYLFRKPKKMRGIWIRHSWILSPRGARGASHLWKFCIIVTYRLSQNLRKYDFSAIFTVDVTSKRTAIWQLEVWSLVDWQLEICQNVFVNEHWYT